MPNTRHPRNHRHREEDAHNNNQQAPAVVAPREVAAAGGGGPVMGHQARQNDNAGARLQKCCSPGSCRFPDDTIDPEDPYGAVKVVCNNEACDEGVWMHKDCFEDFQDSVLSYLRSCGRARSWSEKQRLQNLWTKKGYDLAFKACDCKCARGHLRKDLDYIPPPVNDNSKKHKKHKKKNDKPMPVVSTTHKSNSHSHHVGQVNGNGNHTTPNPSHLNGNANPSHATHVNGNTIAATTAPTHGQQNPNNNQGGRSTNSIAQTNKKSTKKTDHQKSDDNSNVHQQQDNLDNQSNTTTSNPTDTFQFLPNNNYYSMMQGHGNSQLRLRTNSVSSVGSVGSHTSSISSVPSSAGSISPISSSPISGDMFFKSRKSSDASLDTGPTTSAGFRQRLDLSAFASLPRNRQNPYHIRMEDNNTLAHAFSLSCSVASPKAHPPWDMTVEEGGCDAETRNFVLTNLLNKRMCSTRCVLCKTHLPVFDRFPLVDGTFFLSPQPYDEAAIQVIWDGRLQFLNAACLGCLEGRNDIKCVACKQPWDGRYLVIGSMYTYDIFAAAPCCQKRLTCKCCRRAVVDITRGLDFFSQYSHMIICPYCKANDYHFIRSLSETFHVSESEATLQAPICH
ncbi:headcase protein homolog [Littorina saxatilis]|uniref:Headcase middle domain-containing protein n=1 Tax=Littorina saxatilis TaxID=31220 RepID=A0AAN9BK08_9CAEN